MVPTLTWRRSMMFHSHCRVSPISLFGFNARLRPLLICWVLTWNGAVAAGLVTSHALTGPLAAPWMRVRAVALTVPPVRLPTRPVNWMSGSWS